MSDNEMNAGRFCGIDHGAAVRDRDRERLLDKHVLSGRCRRADMRCMKLMGCCDVDRFDLGVGTELLDSSVNARAKILGKFVARFAPRIGGCEELDAWIEAEGRKHDGEGPA